MRSIGVRELRQNASEYLRLVKAGETVEVTEYGRPVARLTPIPPETGDVLDELEGKGLLRRGKGAILAVKPIPPRAGAPLPSKVLEAMREDER